jgi:hypothetical protein
VQVTLPGPDMVDGVQVNDFIALALFAPKVRQLKTATKRAILYGRKCRFLTDAIQLNERFRSEYVCIKIFIPAYRHTSAGAREMRWAFGKCLETTRSQLRRSKGVSVYGFVTPEYQIMQVRKVIIITGVSLYGYFQVSSRNVIEINNLYRHIRCVIRAVWSKIQWKSREKPG